MTGEFWIIIPRRLGTELARLLTPFADRDPHHDPHGTATATRHRDVPRHARHARHGGRGFAQHACSAGVLLKEVPAWSGITEARQPGRPVLERSHGAPKTTCSRVGPGGPARFAASWSALALAGGRAGCSSGGAVRRGGGRVTAGGQLPGDHGGNSYTTIRGPLGSRVRSRRVYNS